MLGALAIALAVAGRGKQPRERVFHGGKEKIKRKVFQEKLIFHAQDTLLCTVISQNRENRLDFDGFCEFS